MSEVYGVRVPADLGKDPEIVKVGDISEDLGVVRMHLGERVQTATPTPGMPDGLCLWVDEDGDMHRERVANHRATFLWLEAMEFVGGGGHLLLGDALFTFTTDIGFTYPQAEHVVSMMVECGDPERVAWLNHRLNIGADLIVDTGAKTT